MYRSYHLFKYHPKPEEDFTVIAHRGASAYFPENTLASFQGAVDLKADMAELDIQLTSDGQIVVFHDEKINRCTDGRGRLADHTLIQLKQLDAGSWFSGKFSGERIPTLDEVLSLCRNKIALNIEIKTEAVTDAVSGGIEEKCLKLVYSYGMQQHVVFSSFDPRALMHLKQIDAAVSVAVLYDRKCFGSKLPSQILEMLEAGAFNCSKRELSRKRLADLRLNRIPFNVYTVNDEVDMLNLLALEASGLFTNRPDVLKKTLENFYPKKASSLLMSGQS